MKADLARLRNQIASDVFQYINWERERGENDLRGIRHGLTGMIKDGLTFKEWKARYDADES